MNHERRTAGISQWAVTRTGKQGSCLHTVSEWPFRKSRRNPLPSSALPLHEAYCCSDSSVC
ncbi:hypothetical protein EYF80_007420 [Liparis tanakae]|uniref:Uncharacterized protein n=1 Tax=Liparis tanakae TaxID=230148 RepID=A0A4Z2IWD9_9TELE|nr:hypothetical protein EYF80_007420 [Liparis tanakae]